MDNFGIFKLLTSAFNFYQKTNGKKSQDNENDEDTSSPLSKLFSNAFNNKDQPQNNQQQNNQPPKKPEKSQPPIIQKPLQEGMLNTMKSHDEFYKRVMEKNKSKQ